MKSHKLFGVGISAMLLLALLAMFTGFAVAAPASVIEQQSTLDMARVSINSANGSPTQAVSFIETQPAAPNIRPPHIPLLAGTLGITVSTTANPTSIVEPGGEVTYMVWVTNTNPISEVTLTGLTDTFNGSLNGKGTCATGSVITNTAYTCSFTATVSGNANTMSINTVTATASDGGTPVQANSDAIVSITDALPDISVTKQATPTAVPETGANVTFNVQVTNNSSEAANLTALEDSDVGNLNTWLTSNCTVPTALTGGETYNCSFTAFISGDASGLAYQNTLTATVEDDETNSLSIADNATVNFNDVWPDISVTKQATPTAVPETGANVTFNVQVTDNSAEEATLTSLTDSDFGNLDNQGTCAVTQTLTAGGGPYTCSFTKFISGDASGPAYQNTITATVQDNETNSLSIADNATVNFNDVLPDISVAKQVSPTAVLESGGDVTFTLVVTNNSAEEATLTLLTDSDFGNLDNQGTCAVTQTLTAGGGPYTCSFTKFISGDASGPAYQNTITATVQDDEANSIEPTATATVDFIDVMPAIEVRKDNDANGNGTFTDNEQAPQGANVTFQVTITNTTDEDVTIDSISDDIYSLTGSDCEGLETTTLAANTSKTCTFEGTIPDDDNLNEVNKVSVTVSDNDGNEVTEFDTSTVTTADILPEITVQKLNDANGDGTFTDNEQAPQGTNVTFQVTITNTTDEDVTIDSISDDIHDLTGSDCEGLETTTLAANTSKTCTFEGEIINDDNATEINKVSVTVSDDDGNDYTASDTSTVTTPDIKPFVIVSKEPSTTSITEPGELVTFDVVVVNPASQDDVTIVSITDQPYGSLTNPNNPNISNSTCATGVFIPTGNSYNCSFQAQVTGNFGDIKTDIVTVRVQDDDSNIKNFTDSATVFIDVNVPSSINVTKTPNKNSVKEPGENVQFTIVVENTSPADKVTINSISDDTYTVTGCNHSLPYNLSPGGKITCTFTEFVGGQPNDTHTNTVTASGVDDDGENVSDDAQATVSVVDVPSSINVTKTATPSSITEPGGAIQFTVRVNNTSPADSVTITGLTDSVDGNLNTKGTCVGAVSQVIPPGDFYQCSYSTNISGTSGEVKSSTVTANANDDDGNSLNDSGNATVTITKLTRVYLPLIVRPGTELFVFNDNTGADVTVVVRNLTTNQEVTRCTVPNGATLPCDHDNDGSNKFPPGQYKVEVTASCGVGSTIKNYINGPNTTRIFCN